MKGSLALLALAGAAVASPFPQAPSAPSGCSPDRAGTFQITVNNVTSTPAKRDLNSRQLDGILTLTLAGGILKDQAGRTGYIAANRQFQFDNPVQAGAVITSGWSVCGNGSLALGGSAIFYQCLSGTFYNLYDRSQGGQCNAIYIVAQGGSMSMSGGPAPPATQIPDGQPQATTKVSQISDGQVQATTATAKVTQISDGQIQATTGKPPVTQISDGQIQATTGRPPVTQISDGQIQATTGAPPPPGPKVTQISDGQIQATTGRPPVTQISDGQIQATTGRPPVTQISDGQIQATTGAPSPTRPPVTQISDGQIQATTGRPPVTQISDGQIQATTGAPPIATFTGAAYREKAGSFAFVAGIVGAVAML